MADLVLHPYTQLSKSLVIAIGLEDGVIAEALASPPLSDNLSVDDALELMDLSFLY